MNITQAISQIGLQAVVNKYNLTCKTDDNLTCLCYKQLETPKNNTTNECRGIVIDSNNNIVSYPFYRFGDYKKHKLDFVNGTFYEKIDGSICTLYFKDKWRISTKTTPTGLGRVHKDSDKTFSDYYFEVLTTDLDILDKNLCYITEFKFPSEYHHLIPCDKPTITLIGLRSMITMQELNPNLLSNDFDVLQGLKFSNEKELMHYINNLDPYVSEGLVYVNKSTIKEGNYQRLKVKSPQFELITLLRTNEFTDKEKEYERVRLNRKWLEQLCKINKHRTFLNDPKYAQFKPVVAAIDKEISNFTKLCTQYENVEINAIKRLNIPQSVKTYLFLKNKGKYSSVQEYLINM